jgi:dTDP-L-rhamnose 4-epimerase
VTIADVASVLQELLGGPDAEILNTYRHGDIRHCYPDVSAARDVLGWEATIGFREGAEDLVKWVATQGGHAEQLDRAFDELRGRGLV